MEIKTENQEFGIKDLVQSFRNYGIEIRKKIWLFVGLFILISGFLVYRWAVDQPLYISKINFMLNDSEGSSMGFNSILGQIGLPTTSQRLNLQKNSRNSKDSKNWRKTFISKNLK
ncbi:MAG: hypothetical protein IPO62_09625 [Saprospiraceae bacterium]|nr:hypothetical protein [Saprospiraceae bacterium]